MCETDVSTVNSTEGVSELVDEGETLCEDAEDVAGCGITGSVGDSDSSVDHIGSLGDEAVALAEFRGGRAHDTAGVRELTGALCEADEGGGRLARRARQDAGLVDQVTR